MCEEGLHDPFTDHVECARYRAQRDMLAQAMERVADDIERTFLGFEGAEDAPAMRWAREFRAALGSLHAPVRDTTMSARDLLPEEERDAIAWVREHGGLDSVKKLLDWVVGHCSTRQQLDFDFWLSGRVMHELGFDEDMADRDEVERRLAARLMPEGMEWPRYDTGEPVPLGGEVTVTVHDEDGDFDRTLAIRSIKYKESGVLLEGTKNEMVIISHGERVKRPAPKVLDADGVEIRVGDTVWYVPTPNEAKECKVEELPGREKGERAVCLRALDGTIISCPTGYVTHERPVLDADGVEIRVGDTVYLLPGDWCDKWPLYRCHGWDEMEVTRISPVHDSNRIECKTLAKAVMCYPYPSQLTHRAPVLAADGLPLREGETVWDTNGDELVIGAFEDGGHTVNCRYADVGDAIPVHGMWSPSDLTHERPDSWQRIEEDAGKDPCGYFGFDGEEICGKCPASGKNCEQTMARDLVRRCRALAERSE